MFTAKKTNTRHSLEFKNTVLVATGFDHVWLNTIYEAADVFEENLNLVALSKDVFLNWRNGSYQSPSFLLSEIIETITPNLLIIPEGRGCFMQLLVDPRVHCLIARTASQKGRIAMTADATLALSRLPSRFHISSSQLLFQRSLVPLEVAKQLFLS
ncbi:MAG: hypothetical protein ACI9EW_000528 [Cellvibrionaceae bacterium]|jgi:hypothetical protein